MISAPIRNAYMDDPAVLAECRRAAWSIFNDNGHRGFRCLGSGYYSAVFSVPGRPSLVLKVGGPGGTGLYAGTGSVLEARSYGADGADRMDVWPEWVRTTAKHGMEDWMPKVYHAEALNGGMYFAVMERLTPSAYGHYAEMGSSGELEMIRSRIHRMLDMDIMHMAWLDLHSGNIMMRGEQYVVTDPISNAGQSGARPWPAQ